MQHLPSPIHHARDAAQLPVAIDYPAALALRQMSMVHDELPKYLLAPEVSALLHYVPDLRRKMLLATLWNTGARINEALALTRGDFSLTSPYPFVQLATLKQRTEKAARTAGRMPAGQQTHRLVPLSDAWYVSQLQTMVATLKIPMERRNKRTGRTEKARIWEVTDRTVRTWIGEAVAAAAADGVTFSVPVTPHTFRHSYAMHMLYAGIPLKVLQSLMGHKSISSTEVYTKAELGNISERRTYKLISGARELPKFLVANPGLNSGFMIPQYTAASIVSQSKGLCMPASVDSIPSSQGQEDHVSMGSNAATKLWRVVCNTERVLAIELFNAAQAIEFRRPAHTSPELERMLADYRKEVPFIDNDEVMYPHIEASVRFLRGL